MDTGQRKLRKRIHKADRALSMDKHPYHDDNHSDNNDNSLRPLFAKVLLFTSCQ